MTEIPKVFAIGSSKEISGNPFAVSHFEIVYNVYRRGIAIKCGYKINFYVYTL